jgi:hypothetical protein
MELWQEAFRGMEEVSGLLDLSSGVLPVTIWGIYFHKLAQIFWRSRDFALHASAWQHFFDLAIRNADQFKPEGLTACFAAPCRWRCFGDGPGAGALSFAEVQFAASSVLLATLTVPLATVDTAVKPTESACQRAAEAVLASP